MNGPTSTALALDSTTLHRDVAAGHYEVATGQASAILALIIQKLS